MKKSILCLSVLVLVLSPVYGGVTQFTDTFTSGPMTNWTEYIAGTYNGAGQYVLSDNDYIYRVMYDTPGDDSYKVSMDISSINMGHSPLGGSSGAGTWFNYVMYSAGTYDLHIMAENVATFPGRENTTLNYGLWGAWDYTETIGKLTSLSLEIAFDNSAMKYTISRAVNGGAMQQVAIHASAGGVNDYKVEYMYAGRTTTFDGDPQIALDNYTITPEPATLMLIGLGGLVLRIRKK